MVESETTVTVVDGTNPQFPPADEVENFLWVERLATKMAQAGDVPNAYSLRLTALERARQMVGTHEWAPGLVWAYEVALLQFEAAYPIAVS